MRRIQMPPSEGVKCTRLRRKLHGATRCRAPQRIADCFGFKIPKDNHSRRVLPIRAASFASLEANESMPLKDKKAIFDYFLVRDSTRAWFCWVKAVAQKRQARAISGPVLNKIIPVLGRAVRKDG